MSWSDCPRDIGEGRQKRAFDEPQVVIALRNVIANDWIRSDEAADVCARF
jgi:hypothetical protein